MTRLAPPGARWKRRASAREPVRVVRSVLDWTIALTFAILLVLAHIVLR